MDTVFAALMVKWNHGVEVPHIPAADQSQVSLSFQSLRFILFL